MSLAFTVASRAPSIHAVNGCFNLLIFLDGENVMDIRSTTTPVRLSELLTNAIRPLESLVAILEKGGLYVEADIAQDLYEVSRSRVEEITCAVEESEEEILFIHNGLAWRRKCPDK